MSTDSQFLQIGRPAIRLDGESKVSGRTRYAADIELPGTLWGKCLRSPFPHARILNVDAADARRLEGVFAVITAADIPDRLIGRRLRDMPVLAGRTVRFIGERVAAVAASTREIAEEALSRIHVEYEELASVTDPLSAMESGAPVLHEDLKTYENLPPHLPDIPNVHSHAQWLFGDPEKGFSESDFIFEQTFTTPRVHHGYLEPHNALVTIDSSERILVWCPAKGPYVTRTHLAEWLQIPEEKIVFQVTPVGGDFGGKASLMDIPLCYYLAKMTGRPVKMIMTYAEELTATNPRHPSIITIRSGVKKDGRIRARELKAIFDSGAYAGFKNNDTVNLPGARHGAGAYAIPHVKIDALSVYTNCVPGGIMRGPGEAQIIFAVECHTDYLARQMGLDPVEFRCLNALKPGDSMHHGHTIDADKSMLLKQVAAEIAGSEPAGGNAHVGRGLAFCVREVGAGEANVEIGLNDEARFYIITTVPDTGTGSHTIFRQIAGETLGVAAEAIEVIVGTTDKFETDVVVAASRVTFLAGQATQKAAADLRSLLLKRAAEHLDCSPGMLEITETAIRDPGKRQISLKDFARRAVAAGETVSVRGNFQVSERTGACFFAQAAQVRVDPETGKIELVKLISAHEPGTVINPLTYQGQVDGGIVQGLGYALMEELIHDDGKIVTSTLGEYKLPNIADVPPLHTLLFQDHDGPGPYHSKPVGEHSAVPTAACIANAVYDAIGVQITDLPLSAERIYAAIKSSGK